MWIRCRTCLKFFSTLMKLIQFEAQSRLLFCHLLTQHQDDAKLFTYEETTRYAEFPALDLNMNEKEIFSDQTQADHDEIFDALDWLRRKTVKDIIELTVPDRLVNPYDEVRLSKYVEKFKGEVRFLDISISVFKDSDSKEHAMGHEKLVVRVSVRPWNPTRERVADLEEIYHTYVQDRMTEDSKPFQPVRVAVIDNGVLSISPSHETHSAFPNGLHTFNNLSADDNVEGSSSKNMSQGEYQIDKNGRQNTLSSPMKKGQSFVEENFRVSPWFFASDPHETEMANLICAIDPCCDLYVAKVNEERSGIIPARVERIEWSRRDFR
ncbi:hypothetical protein MAC_08979 [Metarhizium acridum CQMa 102]|uniref:Uncharacterized protein n=1 Tax=Metarhizium acridum (strain CQMa 102) TaxID=655827 RepID=E9EGI1_METAQ|nr:uncharacterized protein MAC_08979 [Metarhizium acridum CQMa 102]EFY84995.1 hypothetical protein MAC_08979 [Metarhizium acridum CQMa 102]